MKKLLLLSLLVISFVSHSQTITIGEGTEITDQVPVNLFYKYAFTEQIYLAEEIEFAGYIKAINFRIAYSYNSDFTADINVYMKNVTRSTFEDGVDFEPLAEENLVFSGQWTIPANVDDWLTIELDTPFYYNGTDNLMIAIDKNSENWAIRYFKYTDASFKTLTYNSDTDNPDPYDLGSFTGQKEVMNYRANTKLVFGHNDNVVEISSETLSVYPNPATDILYLEVAENEMISICDAMGRLVMQQVYNKKLDVSSLAKGVYAVKTGNQITKFVKE